MNHNSCLSSIKRALNIYLKGNNAFFLWGARKTGKSTLLHAQFPQAKYYDLLDTSLRTNLLLHPEYLRQEILANKYPLVIVDEVQKVPILLDEIHWLLENTPTKFILCGSSARKLKRGAANLLGGRAWRYQMFPLVSEEIDIDLDKALNNGLLPQHYLRDNPQKYLQGYVADYINEEIQAEAMIRNIPAFAKFLETAAISNGQLINYANIARNCGVSGKTVREYFQILEDTLLGYTLVPWVKPGKRRLIESAKFYYFDMGVVRALRNMILIQPGTIEYGQFFEHFILNEIKAYIGYKEKYESLYFWRTSSGFEVDVIVGDMKRAIGIKADNNIDERDLKGLKMLQEDYPKTPGIVVCLEEVKRQAGKSLLIYPWKNFLSDLWAGNIF